MQLKATNIDTEQATFVRDSVYASIQPLIQLTSFWEECKGVKLKPLYKKETKTDLKNYMPASRITFIVVKY